MNHNNVSRRGFLGGTLLGASLPGVSGRGGVETLESLSQVPLRPDIRERVEAGRKTILDELKPTRAQLERGLELHYNSYVVDLMGALYTSAAVGHRGRRLETELSRFRRTQREKGLSRRAVSKQVRERWRRLKTFESAFDAEWQANFWALYRVTGLDLAVEDNAHHYTWSRLLRHLASCNLVYGQLEDVVRIAKVGDLTRARRDKKLAILSNVQGVTHAWVQGQSVEHLELLYGLGVRMAHLTHGERNALGSDCYQLPHRDSGLTMEGREVVRRMNELGVMVDIAHAARRTALDAIEISTEAVLNSHTGCEAIYDDRDHRNVDDEYLQVLSANGGLVGIYVWPGRLSSERTHPSFSDWARHLEHAIQVAGIDHVGIGTDVSYLPHYPPHPMDWTNYAFWTVGLVCRGFSDQEIRKVLGKNFLFYAAKVLDKSPRGEFL